MNAIKKILGSLSKVVMIIMIVLMALITLLAIWIFVLPDSIWKPVYVSWDGAAASSGEGAASAEGQSSQAAAEPAAAEGAAEPAPELAQPITMKPGQGLMVDTGSKIVNLMDPSGRKYLRIGIVLEYQPPKLEYFTMSAEEKKVFVEEFNTELTAMMPIINNSIITLLSSQTFESVYTAEGKEKLRQDIMDTINTQLPEYRVIFVYFTEFVVQ
jgi:flagellar FliL protein